MAMTATALLPGQLALDLDAQPEEEPEPLPLTVPTERIRPYVEAWLADGQLLRDLAEKTGTSPETLRAIKQGKRTLTKFRVADKIITAIDVWAWHRPPPKGLADVYGSPLVRSMSRDRVRRTQLRPRDPPVR